MAAKKISSGMPDKVDAGFEDIDTWHRWFVTAHRQRMHDDGYDADAIVREGALIDALAANIRERMRDQYLSNRARTSQP
jgi:hypothetical protein